MAVPSTMLPLGTKAPEFELPDVTTGRTVSNTDFAERQGAPRHVHLPALPYVANVRTGLASSSVLTRAVTPAIQARSSARVTRPRP